MADRGLAQLAAAHRAAPDATGGEAGFIAVGRAHVRLAQEKPGLFRLMFANSPRDGSEAWRFLAFIHLAAAMLWMR
jgi:hypothetical protein